METRERVVQLHLKGMSNGQIGLMLNLSRGTVGGHLYRWRRGPRIRQPRADEWTDEQDATLLEMHAAGDTSAAIGEALGKSSEAIRKRAHRLGLSFSDRAPKPRLAFTVPNLTEKQIEEAQRESDRRFVRALAAAYQRGEFPAECYAREAA
jgi:transposase